MNPGAVGLPEPVPVFLRTRRGDTVFGILHAPSGSRARRIGVSLLNPGLKNRVAPNRLNVRLARRLAARGYWVLRIDPPGVGDAEGEIPEAMLPEVWQDVQKGAFVEAVRDVHEAFEHRCELDEIIGAGNCGGAITALLEAAGNPRVRRLVLVDIPVTLRDPSLVVGARIHSRRHASTILRAYARRTADWRAWWSLLNLKTDFRTVVRALRRHVPLPGGQRNEGSADRRVSPEQLSSLFLTALQDFDGRGGRALFVTAQNDDNSYAFDEHFASRHWDVDERFGARHDRIVVPESNHIYGTPEWRELLMGGVEAWLERSEPLC